jgi:ornithine carbamoyltransferase
LQTQLAVLSRYVDAIMIRTLSHDALLELSQHATVPSSTA